MRFGTLGVPLAAVLSVWPLAGKALSQQGPHIQFEERSFDFGTVGQQFKVVHVYRFRNTGEAPLQVGSVETSCGCTAAMSSPGAVPPGGMGEIKATYDSGFQHGAVTKTITVHSNDPQQPAVQLTLLGKVVPEVDLQPMAVFLGNVQRGDPIDRQVTIVPAHPEGFRIRSVRSSSKFVGTRLEEGPGSWTLHVSLAPETRPGSLNERVVVETTDPKASSLTIPVAANVMGDLHAEPEVFYFSVITPGSSRSQTVVVTKSGRPDLSIRKVVSTSPHIRVRVKTLEQGVRYALEATVVRNAPPGPFHGAIEVHTNDPDEPVLSIPIVGVLQKP